MAAITHRLKSKSAFWGNKDCNGEESELGELEEIGEYGISYQLS